MTDNRAPRPTTASSWRFPATFWIANVIELGERAAYYGTFIFLTVFLTSVVGYSDVASGWIVAAFAGALYLLPLFAGAAADRIGYRRALLLAFAFLSAGYAALALLPHKGVVLLSLLALCLGGALVKPVITGTVARTSDADHRARAFSLFYMLVNIGSFTGKAVAKPVRAALGVGAIPLYSAGAACFALLLVALFYFPDRSAGRNESETKIESKTLRGVLDDLKVVLRNRRFLALVLITAGYWTIQGQLYASMPKFVLRMVGEDASPEWYANINPMMVVLLVVPITHLCRRLPPLASIGLCLGLVPLSALSIAVLPGVLSPARISLLGRVVLLPAMTQAMCIGIALQGLAECFLTPRYYEFASRQAPKGQEGLYMGYGHLNTFFAWLFGFILSGYLLEAFCPDPARLPRVEQVARLLWLRGEGPVPAAYAHAAYLWYTFAAIGACAFALLLVFHLLTRRRPLR